MIMNTYTQLNCIETFVHNSIEPNMVIHNNVIQNIHEQLSNIVST
jgi:hypothetical protein